MRRRRSFPLPDPEGGHLKGEPGVLAGGGRDTEGNILAVSQRLQASYGLATSSTDDFWPAGRVASVFGVGSTAPPDPVLLEARIELGAGQAEQAGRSRLVTPRLAQGLGDELFLDRLQVHAAGGQRAGAVD